MICISKQNYCFKPKNCKTLTIFRKTISIQTRLNFKKENLLYFKEVFDILDKIFIQVKKNYLSLTNFFHKISHKNKKIDKNFRILDKLFKVKAIFKIKKRYIANIFCNKHFLFT